MSEPTSGSSRRISAFLLILGAVVGFVGNGLHPHTVDTDPAASLAAIAQNGGWVWIHLAIIVAILFVIGGLVGFAHDLELEERSAPFARLGTAASLVGGALVCVSTAIDGFGRKALALAWTGSSAGQSDAALQIGISAQLLGQGIWTLGILVWFGCAFACFGAAAIASRRFPAWFGWSALAGAAGSAIAAILRVANNGDVQLAESLFLGSSVLITLWALALGVFMWRSPAPRTAGATVAAAAR